MLKKTNTSVFFKLLFLLLFVHLNQGYSQKKIAKPGIRFGFGPVLGFYSINPNHAKNPSQKISALFSFKKELKCNKKGKTFFSLGAEYFLHGLNFKSYYFKPDSLQLYDRTFSYNYALVIKEISIPIQYKYLFKSETNSVFSPYFMLGYHLKYLLSANLKVTQNGIIINEEEVNLKFRKPLIFEHLNSLMSVTVGFQKNSINNSPTNFFTEVNLRYGPSQYYFEKSYAASSLYINSLHIAIQVGVKF